MDGMSVSEFFWQLSDSDLKGYRDNVFRRCVKLWNEYRNFKKDKKMKVAEFKHLKGILFEEADYMNTYWIQLNAEVERRSKLEVQT